MEGKELCGKWMPLKKTTCMRGAGHKDFCRTAAAVGSKRQYIAELWATNPKVRERHKFTSRQWHRRRAIDRDRKLIQELEAELNVTA